jgi:hypothetical protein
MQLITPRRALAALLMTASLGLAACGSTASSPAGGTTTVQGVTGCTTNSAPASRAPANVVVHPATGLQEVKATVGQVIEVQLAFGRKYALFPSGNNVLSEQSHSGFADATAHSCIYRFKATQAGATDITFITSPICKASQECPQNMGRMVIPVQVQS